MKINIDKLNQEIDRIKKDNNISNAELSTIMGLDYSYIFRIIKQKQSYGIKIIDGIERLCNRFNLKIDDFIFLEEKLPVGNK